MEYIFRVIYGFASLIRDDIYVAIKKQNPDLKPYQVWAKYDAWDEEYTKHEYMKIKGRNGKFLPRLENSRTLRFWAEFENFTQMGKFIDSITADKNAVIELDNGESWKLAYIDSPYDGLFNGKEKLPSVLVCYEQI